MAAFFGGRMLGHCGLLDDASMVGEKSTPGLPGSHQGVRLVPRLPPG
jgi:hypothetical protein